MLPGSVSKLRPDWDIGDLDLIKVLAAISLLHGNPDYFEPVLLAKDNGKEATPQRITKAKKRGVHGTHVGRKFESIPHYRRPHFATRWTGKGGATPKIVPVRGSIVKQKRMVEMPTGYLIDGTPRR